MPPAPVPVPSVAQTCPRCGATYGEDATFCALDGTRLTRKNPADPYIGTVIADDIEIKALAGSGAMGKVYRGHQRGTGRDVAVKILNGEFLDRTQLVQRFAREAKIAARLRHPHVVDVYFTGELPGGIAYIVMEYLDGTSLAAALQEAGGRLPIDRALTIALQICDAVGEANLHGIVHRDLKPENVMLVTRAQPQTKDWVKVLDFGIARAVLPDESMETAAGAVFGTAKYISPEGAQGFAVTPASDVYSIAVMLYQMLSGRAPFEGDQAVGLLIKHVHDAPTPLRSWPDASQVSPELERVVMECLAKNPGERASDGRALAAILVRAARASGISLSGVERFSVPEVQLPEVPALVAPTLDEVAAPPRPPLENKKPDKAGDRRALARTAITILAFLLGVALTAIFMQRRAGPSAERAAHVERTRSALTDGHYTAPPGENVRDLVAEGLTRWPSDVELRQLRSEAEHEMITMAMAARASGDLVGARNLARDAYLLDPTDNSARFLRAQLEDELRGIASGATVETGSPRLVFESQPVAKPGEKVEMTLRIVPGSAGSRAKITGIKVTVLPNGQSTGAVPVTVTLVDRWNVRSALVAPGPGSYDVSAEASVDGVGVRAMRDLDVAP